MEARGSKELLAEQFGPQRRGMSRKIALSRQSAFAISAELPHTFITKWSRAIWKQPILEPGRCLGVFVSFKRKGVGSGSFSSSEDTREAQNLGKVAVAGHR